MKTSLTTSSYNPSFGRIKLPTKLTEERMIHASLQLSHWAAMLAMTQDSFGDAKATILKKFIIDALEAVEILGIKKLCKSENTKFTGETFVFNTFAHLGDGCKAIYKCIKKHGGIK